MLAASAEEPGKYTLILCNAIGMPLSTKQIPLEPVLLAMTPEHLVVASPDTVFMWRYDAEGASSSELPRGWQRRSRVEAETRLSVPSGCPLAGLQHCWTHLLAAFQ